RQCRDACAVAYSTARTLQRRYPAGRGAFVTHYSSIDLHEDAFVQTPPEPRERGPFTLVTVGALEELYKGTDVLIRAVDALARGGVDVRLRVVGDGRRRPELETLARSLGLANRIDFVGNVPHERVPEELDRSDLFALPTRGEGLPRAVIEAMARGLP